MPISSTTLVPEFQHYTNKLIINTVLNKNVIPFSSPIDEQYLNDNKSFIRLLFDNDWPDTLTSYRYLYRQESLTLCPQAIKVRLMLYPQSAKYYVCDSDDPSRCNINIFNLHLDDLIMLDKLLEYRLDSTSVTLITIDYSSLSTSISKLIYIYLDLKINNTYAPYDNDTIISDPTNPLQNFYELYVIEEIYNTVSDKGI